jgi:hypothetical protein
MQNAAEISTVAHVIQLAVAPVFLLTGIGAILSVITNRIARIVDRSRAIEQFNGSQAGRPSGRNGHACAQSAVGSLGCKPLHLVSRSSFAS